MYQKNLQDTINTRINNNNQSNFDNNRDVNANLEEINFNTSPSLSNKDTYSITDFSMFNVQNLLIPENTHGYEANDKITSPKQNYEETLTDNETTEDSDELIETGHAHLSSFDNS